MNQFARPEISRATSLRKAFGLVLIAGVSALLSCSSEPSTPSKERSFDVLTNVYTVDRKYRSMKGPMTNERIVLSEGEEPELLWITGYEAIVTDSTGTAELPQDFMCHSNLNVHLDEHLELFQWPEGSSRRLFTLSQGQTKIQFPEGFGIPVMSNEPLELQSQVLNLNIEDEPFEVRHKVTVKFVKDSELSQPMKALLMRPANSFVSLDGDAGYFNVESPDPSVHGEGCLVGEKASGRAREDKHGRRFSGHWVVKPGREENHTLVTEYLNLPFDTTVHYIASHLHPFAKTLELRDLTTGKTVFMSTARNFENKIGLEYVDAYSSTEGLPLYRDHEYELISIYENTSDADQDSMAVMFLYVLDKNFDRSAL